jgi:deoxyribodipyrimidine photolyase-related protein
LSLRIILGDQCSRSISSLRDANKENDIILMMEVGEEAEYAPHHVKKIAFIFSVMRHFAEELRAEGFKLRYIKFDDPQNTHSVSNEIKRAIHEFKPSEIIITSPSEYRVLENIKLLSESLPQPIHIISDDRFLSSHAEFAAWASGKKTLRMEFFYRELRKQYNILMDPNGKPHGGEWNFDKENRKPPQKNMKFPPRLSFKKDQITLDVLNLVRETFPKNFGTLEPFHFAVTRTQALQEAKHFIEFCLPSFGDFQDAMVAGEAYLYHSLLSSYLNVGLLLPLEICQMAEKAYRDGNVSLNSAEGFIRQILGWREYVRGIYWLEMPSYKNKNFFNANRALPEFYWTAKTDMFCMAETIRHTRDHAYSHHIQRLMVTGNFALLAGIDPRAVCDWYLGVYSDAYEWVELPNTLGMALFGDGGMLGSKPYAASGKYIHRMSNYCKHCKYDPDEIIGDRACPFNALYWDFVARHEDTLRSNGRMIYMYSTWDKMSVEKQISIRKKATETLLALDSGEL